MPADREGERVGHSNFLRLYRSNFTDWVVGGGRKGCRRLLLSEAALLVYMPAVGKHAGRFFGLSRSSFTDWVLGEKKRISASLYSKWQGFSMHVKGSEARARGVSLIWVFDIL